LRRKWKVQRDCSRRGYTTDQVLEELDRRERDSELYIRPQREWADMVVSFMPGNEQDQLDAMLTLSAGLNHPDLGPLLRVEDVEGEGGGHTVSIPGDINPAKAAEVEEGVWERMHFANHLRTERLGEFTIGTDLHRSESLAIVQVLVLYHLATARAAVALGGKGSRADRGPGSRPDTAEAPS
ncbi:MAG: hypothetical protein H0V25_06505, partial [Solirubrobacterales bacterium]|nr:hypothetical protein [Solirubrobacterales bacterium]